ncbi:putative GPI anchored protein [Aspergillus tanneri]|uniref:Uncharacterized protein n=1 Tax=Aspergillus tanneri TaxID=1220188 RepID=A0A5M9N1K4_9EURO|nr:uncharacterized protein ATNIH1004_001070 [Aspergillus tanneri]KAA8652166.1 hypothetical protein ATNIH1004_001070 [Aspergillus tanneri]
MIGMHSLDYIGAFLLHRLNILLYGDNVILPVIVYPLYYIIDYILSHLLPILLILEDDPRIVQSCISLYRSGLFQGIKLGIIYDVVSLVLSRSIESLLCMVLHIRLAPVARVVASVLLTRLHFLWIRQSICVSHVSQCYRCHQCHRIKADPDADIDIEEKWACLIIPSLMHAIAREISHVEPLVLSALVRLGLYLPSWIVLVLVEESAGSDYLQSNWTCIPMLLMLLVPLFLLGLAHASAHANLSHLPESILSEDILQHNALIQAHLAQIPVRGVRKMNPDEGEKFFLDYWYFDDAIKMGNSTQLHDLQERIDLQPRSHPHHPPSFPQMGHLFRRDYKCPSGTFSCASIDRPNSCCSTGETCELVKDAGSGDVGCCPQGQNCSGSVGKCKSGYSTCAASLGGGCCIPGYDCVSDGCARVYTITVTLSSTVMTSTSTQSIPPTSTVSSHSTTTTVTSKETKSTGDFSPPARPTSLSTATTSQSQETGDVCPLGFYACSAVYRGGCCRTGRDCDTTSCPSTPSTTITTNDRTIVVPMETTASGDATGRCADGWFSCADTAGGGCCPTGFACGSSCTALATATATATGTVAKEQPTGAASRRGLEVIRVGISVMGVLWMMR